MCVVGVGHETNSSMKSVASEEKAEEEVTLIEWMR